MKKFTKVLSAVLSAAMVLPTIPVSVAAAEVSTGVIDFNGESDGALTTSGNYYGDYIYSDYNNLYIKEKALVVYGKNQNTSYTTNTMSHSINAGKLLGVKTDGGVLTYKFKYKWDKKYGSPSNISLKFANKDGNDISKDYSSANPNGYFGVGAQLTYEQGLTVDNTDKWNNAQSTWTNEFSDVEVKVDFYGKRVGFKEGNGEWCWKTMDSTKPLESYWRLGLRGTLGAVKNAWTEPKDYTSTMESDFYMDDISVSYTTEPLALESGVIDFTGVADDTALTGGQYYKDYVWSDYGNLKVKNEALYTYGVKYKNDGVTPNNNNTLSMSINASKLTSVQPDGGKLTYKFKYKWTKNSGAGNPNDISIKLASKDGNDVNLSYTSDSSKGYFGIAVLNYENGLNVTGDGDKWSNLQSSWTDGYCEIQIQVDFTNKKLGFKEGDGEWYWKDMDPQYNLSSYWRLGFRATMGNMSASPVIDPDFYMDDISVSYEYEPITVGDVTHTWLGGIKVPFGTAMNKESVENGIVLKDNDAPKTVSATVIYNEETKTATVTPTEALDTSHSHTITIGDSVKTASGIYVSDAIGKNFTLEALQDVAINDSDITLFDESGTDLIKRVKTIKVKFNTPMDKTSLETAGNIVLYKEGEDDTVPLSAAYDMTNGNTVTLTLGEELDPNTKYYLYFGTGVERIDGKKLDPPITKTINTPVLEKPQIVKESVNYTDKLGTTGKMDTMKKRITRVSIPFDVALDKTTVDKANIKIEGRTIEVGYDESKKTVNIIPDEALAGDTEYTVSFTSGVKAINGEPIADNSKTFEFKTATVDLPKIVSVTASADGTNFSDISEVADINSVKATFNYTLNTTSATPSTGNIKLEKQTDNGWVEVTEATPKLENDAKTYTWSLASGNTLPEGTKFRIRITTDLLDSYGDKPASESYENFETKISAAAKNMDVSILGKTVSYSGKLLSGSVAEANQKMSVLLYKQGGSATPFGADTKHFEIVKTAADGSFSGEIKLYDDETAPVFNELWLAFDAQSMGKSNARDAKVAVQYANAKMNDASIADMKKSTKQVLTYITEAADSSDIKAIVPDNGLTASQNKKLYESMGVWVDKYEALTDDEKAAANKSLDSYKQTLTAENIAKIVNASIIAADYQSLATDDAVDMIGEYDKQIEAIVVEGKNFSDLSETQQSWVANNVKNTNADGFVSHEDYVKEVRKSMLLSMIATTPYTELRELLLNNKDLVNDGLSENKLASLESETDTKITDAAMQTIKLANQNSKYTETSKLASDVATAVKNAQNNASGNTNKNDSKNDHFSVAGGGGGSYVPDNKKDDNNTDDTNNEPSDDNNEVTNKIFGDIAGYEWAENAIMTLYDKGIVSGTGDGKFEPGRGVTREEFLKLVCEAFGFATSDKGTAFEDVKSGEWYEKYIAAAVDLGIVKGVSDTEFGIGSLVTREDMAVMIFRSLEASGREITSDRKTFNDNAAISDYAAEAVSCLGGMGIINGVGDNNFAPANNATRAEAAVIINRCLQ